jgi:hypothetical protein
MFWEKFLGNFCYCVNIIEYTYTNLDGAGLSQAVASDAIKRHSKHKVHETATCVMQNTVL